MDNKEYYKNLLIIQYHDKPNAQATIGAMYDNLMPVNSKTGNLLSIDVQNAFDIDTAVGVQLDIIGYYIGVDRLYKGQNLDNIVKFGFDDYTGFSTATLGFNTYSTFINDNSGGTLTYNNLISSTNKLLDNDYRFVLKLKAAQNNCDYSSYSIDKILYDFFGSDIYYIDNKDMTMTYFFEKSLLYLVSIAMQKGLFLKPMGVGIQNVIKKDIYFGFLNYNSKSITYNFVFDDNSSWIDSDNNQITTEPILEGITSDYVSGFCTYSNYATINYNSLTYNDLIEV